MIIKNKIIKMEMMRFQKNFKFKFKEKNCLHVFLNMKWLKFFSKRLVFNWMKKISNKNKIKLLKKLT